MTKHTTDAVTDAALRDLDPAPDVVLTESELERAEAVFARVVASPGRPDTPGRRERTRPRWGRVLVPVGLVGAAGAAVPALLLSGSAFGSWTPTPESLAGTVRADAATTCRERFGVDGDEQVVIADRRGDWTYVLISGPRLEQSCLMDADLVGRSGSTTATGFMGSSTTDPAPEPDLPPGGLEGYGAVGSMPVDGWWPFGDDEEWLTQVAGYVGSDVEAVTVHTPIGTDVEASVADGRFAAWWPSAAPGSEHPEVDNAWTYTVTLADGTTREARG